MMNICRHTPAPAVIVSLAGIAAIGHVRAQSPDQSAARPGAKRTGSIAPTNSAPPDGFWPTPKLLDLMLRRMADNVGSDFELDEEARPRFQNAVARRWETYLTEHRSSIQPVFTDFLEMRLGLEPPTKEQLQAWAGRALPVFRGVRDEIEDGTDDLRDILKPEQRAKFELRRLKLAAGLAYAEAKLTLAESGQVTQDDLREFWEPTRAERERRRQEERDRRQAEESAPAAIAAGKTSRTTGTPDVIAEEMTAWARYVDAFMRTYDFDDGQRDAALSFLAELRRRAITHRDARRERIIRLEKRIAQFDGKETELADLKKKLNELYGPIDKMFVELKNRLDAIPTAQQRATVASHERRTGSAAPTPSSPPKP